LRSYGIIVCGETIEESFCLSSYVMSAVDTQVIQVYLALRLYPYLFSYCLDIFCKFYFHLYFEWIPFHIYCSLCI